MIPVATITDDDAAPQLSIGDVTVTEGGTAQFTIELDAVSGKDVSFNWATSDGTATAGSDYTTRTSQSLTIAAGQQSATVSVQTTDDGDDEANETFTVALSGATNATISDATGEATIADNDDAPDPDPDPDPDEWDHNGLTLTGTNGFDYLRGSNRNDLMDGRGGPDRIEGGFGDDRMTGGGGADRFVLSGNRGHDIITDFNPDDGDTIILTYANFSSFSQMIESHAEQAGDDVVIYTSPSREDHSLTLLDIELNELDAAQFTILGGPSTNSAHSLAAAFVGWHEPLFLQVNEGSFPADDADFFVNSQLALNLAESQGDLIW